MLLPKSENLCCLDSDHVVYIWICYPIHVLKELLNEPPCVCIIYYILDGKVKRDSSKSFFPFIQYPFFWVVRTSTFCLLKTYQFLVIHECPSVFLKQFVSLITKNWYVFNEQKSWCLQLKKGVFYEWKKKTWKSLLGEKYLLGKSVQFFVKNIANNADTWGFI